MQRTTVTRLGLAALLSLVLASCSIFERPPPPSNPVVSVKDGKISVAPDPLRFKVVQGPVDIVWRLAPDSGATFPDDGITIDGRLPFPPAEAQRMMGQATKPDPRQTEIVDCRRRSATEFSCRNRNTTPGVYKYTIRVVTKDGKLPPFDPHIVNE